MTEPESESNPDRSIRSLLNEQTMRPLHLYYILPSLPRLDYQPLIGKMSPRYSPERKTGLERAAEIEPTLLPRRLVCRREAPNVSLLVNYANNCRK